MVTHKIVFRTDASINIGTGHVIRCITLAEKLRNAGAEIAFICREHPGNLCSLIDKYGYRILRLPNHTLPSSSGNLAHSHWLGVSQEEDVLEKEAGKQKSAGDNPKRWVAFRTAPVKCAYRGFPACP